MPQRSRQLTTVIGDIRDAHNSACHLNRQTQLRLKEFVAHRSHSHKEVLNAGKA
jgi:hypothetical protein